MAARVGVLERGPRQTRLFFFSSFSFFSPRVRPPRTRASVGFNAGRTRLTNADCRASPAATALFFPERETKTLFLEKRKGTPSSSRCARLSRARLSLSEQRTRVETAQVGGPPHRRERVARPTVRQHLRRKRRQHFSIKISKRKETFKWKSESARPSSSSHTRARF